jgi:hypothetical protein
MQLSKKHLSRVVIYGSPGSGKSTLAKKLATMLNIPVIHLDDIFWLPNWVEMKQTQFRDYVSNFIKNNSNWIIDGNYSRVRDLILPHATLAIYINLPTYTVIWRLFSRTVSRNTPLKLAHVTPLPKNIEQTGGDEEGILKPFFELSYYAILHKLRKREKMKQEIDSVIGIENLIIFNNAREIKDFLSLIEHAIFNLF